jgi:hypothetical protein
MYSQYMPKHLRKKLEKIADFDVQMIQKQQLK